MNKHTATTTGATMTIDPAVLEAFSGPAVTHVSIAEATRMLQLTRKTVSVYIEKGRLERVEWEGRPWISIESIHRCMQWKGIPTYTPATGVVLEQA